MKAKQISSDVVKRSSWMLEELIEFMEAETLEDQVDALTDLIYFAIGTFTLMGVKPEPFFNIVHAANMGKLHEDGKPRFNEQGKIVKPEGWAEKYAPEPKIVQELMRQSDELN
ncbi:transcriptional regulator [Paenibacillus sp. JCM 10914]|nr:transcriptional regulator [Paenibacillus sp. JCM 10914]